MSRGRPSIPFLLDLLSLAVRKEASAVYIVPWMPPTLRLDDRTVALSSASFTPEQTAALVRDMLDDAQRSALDQSREIQFSFVREGVGRFRVHAFRRHGQPAMAIRPFALPVPTLQSLHLPQPLQSIALADRGLVLVASRSPSLRGDVVAAMVDHRNREGRGTILLLEDASRHWHDAERCAVEQGVLAGQALARAEARAQQPDAAPLGVSWGELRDQPALERAVRASAGALCFATLEADTVVDALLAAAALAESGDGAEAGAPALPDSFGRPQSLLRLAVSLEAAVALRRVTGQASRHELAAAEVLLNAPEVAASLADRDGPALRAAMTAARGRGALLVDDHLLQLAAQGLLGFDEALHHCEDVLDVTRRWQLGPQAAPTTWVHPRPPPPAAPLPRAAPPASDFDPFAADPAADGDGSPPRLPPLPDTSFDSVEWPRTDHPAEPVLPAPGRSGGGDTQDAERPDRVQFRAWAPVAMAPGGGGLVEVWASLPSQQAALERLAAAASAGDGAAGAAEAGSSRGTLVGVQLRIDGLGVDEPAGWLDWTGEPAGVAFTVGVPPDAAAGTHAARVRLSAAGLPIGELNFLLTVAHDADDRREDTHAARRMLRSAFASYAPEDRAEVLARVQAVAAVAPDLELFIDAPGLRAGADWRERIEREFGRRERLFLFWSPHARESPWVDFEWRLALRTRGIDAIDPVPLAGAPLAPPPPELTGLDFGAAGRPPAAHRPSKPAAARPRARR